MRNQCSWHIMVAALMAAVVCCASLISESTSQQTPQLKADRIKACQPCQNGGRCVDGSTPLRCLCPLGYTGTTCSHRLTAYIPKFSGQSYLELDITTKPLRDKFKFEVFFTAKELNGLLMYAGNLHSDYMIVVIANGIVTFRFSCGSGVAVLKARKAISHGAEVSLTVGREGRSGYLEVNGDYVTRNSRGSFDKLDLSTNLFIGGVPANNSFSCYQLLGYTGFVGCIRLIKLNNKAIDLYYKRNSINIVSGLDISDCAPSVCSNAPCGVGTCIPDSYTSHTCICPVGRSGSTCSIVEDIDDINYIPHFSANSYLLYQNLPRSTVISTDITLQLKLYTDDGLLLYTGSDVANQKEENADFLALHLESRHVVLSVDLGNGVFTLRSRYSVPQDSWIEIKIVRVEERIILNVDNQTSVHNFDRTEKYMDLNAGSNLYIGGHEDLEMLRSEVNVSTMFSGCVMQTSVNGIQLLTRDAVRGRSVASCVHACQQNGSCANGGVEGGRCVPKFDGYRCACPLGFTGPMCDKETGQISVPYFSGSGFLLITDLTVISRLNKKRWGIKIKMRPQCTNCVILWTGQNRSVLKGDFLLVGIDQDGYPYVSYDLGGGTVTLTDRRNKLTKNTLQIIRIHRTDEVCVLKTGATETFEMIENTRGYTELNSNSGLYIGGHPEGVGYTNYKPFVGCIISLSINDLDIPMMMRAACGEDIQQCHSAGT